VVETAAVVIVCVSYSGLVFHRGLDSPFVYIWIGTALFLGVAVVLSRGGLAFKAALFNLAVLVMAMGIAEAYLGGWLPWGSRGTPTPALTREGEFFGRIGGGYFRPDEIRGYAAEANVKAHERVRADDHLLRDIVYTTDANGLRVAPHDIEPALAISSEAYENVAFFGCSVTVGEGVDDRETMPWAFEALSRGKYRVSNLGFHGYGPHQMLRILETGLIERLLPGRPPAKAVYQGLIEHIERSAGNYPAISWGPSAPRYVLRADGTPVYSGAFYTGYGSAVLSALNRSYLFPVVAPFAMGWRRTARDIDLYVAIVKQSKELFAARYGGRFVVVMWGTYDRDYATVVERLRRSDIRVLEVHTIIPDIYSADWKYKLQGDEHPNPTAHVLLAKFLLAEL
jgi:hypothetical protein